MYEFTLGQEDRMSQREAHPHLCSTHLPCQAGGLLTNEHGYVVREWRYDPVAHIPPLSSALIVKLNRSITFEFCDRSDIRIKFACEGVNRDLDVSVRPKREGSYVEKR